ncbi:hypothetical protein [uncultured Bartonella sp.]|uniref:hypothetical protein n=1 Tax=uncultured Bartonella sp. TaxID=104108 RepID=UPI00262A3638|nr:hypothetical protein [uncultured Bartonella sp.]
MTKSDKKPAKSLNRPDPEDHRKEALPNRNAYKTNETIVDGGNVDDDNSPLSVSNSPLFEENITSGNLSTDKDK